MRKLLIIIAITLLGSVYFYPDYLRNYSTMLRLNSNPEELLPRNFRITPLNASGSSQFSESNLKNVLQTIPHSHIIIVDLREEPHGFLNGDAISWYNDKNWLNKDKTENEIGIDEYKRLSALSNQNFAVLYMKKGHYPYLYKVDEVANEETVVLRNGAQYIQFPVSDHLRPTDKVIDKFITFVKNLPDEVWLHFHCSAGKGRTTTFLAMYDMMKNATNATVDEIVNRQQSYGGMNLFKEYDEDDWRIIHFEDRVSFINNFYQYCIENPDFDLSWSEWEEKRSFLQ